MLYTGKKKKKKQTYKPSVSYCNDEIKERFQSSLLSWGVFLNLQSIQVFFITIHGSVVTLSDTVLIFTLGSIFTFDGTRKEIPSDRPWEARL